MNAVRLIISACAAVLVVAATGYADMKPVCSPGADVRAACSCDRPGPLSTAPVTSFGRSGMPYLGPRSAAHTAEARPDVGLTHAAQTLQILRHEQDSLSFCLYALLGLGLLKSVPCAKRLSLGVVPGWYHDGAPSQIGHSLAISPDCFTSTPVCCFIQPESMNEAPALQYHQRGIVSLWRASQFTATVLASRAPPSRSYKQP